ncbi:unnamed protein product [Urochloa humidicola]
MAVAGRASGGAAVLRPLLAAPGMRPPARAIHEGPVTIEELLDRQLVKKPTTVLDDDALEAEARRRVKSSRREALGLHTDILREMPRCSACSAMHTPPRSSPLTLR